MNDEARPHNDSPPLGKQPSRPERRTIGKDTPAARWRRMVQLARQAQEALQAGRYELVGDLLGAIEAVARRSAEEELGDR